MAEAGAGVEVVVLAGDIVVSSRSPGPGPGLGRR